MICSIFYKAGHNKSICRHKKFTCQPITPCDNEDTKILSGEMNHLGYLKQKVIIFIGDDLINSDETSALFEGFGDYMYYSEKK